MKSLILAEKPSVGKEIGRVLKCSNRKKSHWEGGRYVVTWAMGHLVELAEPGAYNEQYSPKNTTGKSCPVCGKPLMTVRSKRGETLVCHSLSCGYEEERNRDGTASSRPTKRERDTARRYMRQYKSGSDTASFADLIRAAEERKKEDT